MMRVIITPAVLPPDALAELKEWLAITTTADDGPLSALLATAIEVCTDFTGLTPIMCTCEETLPLPAAFTQLVAGPPPCGWPAASDFGQGMPGSPACRSDWQQLVTRPVQSIVGVAGLTIDGTAVPVPAGSYDYAIGADGGCSIRLTNPGMLLRYTVQFTAGLATGWDQLPFQLRHGIIRLAAHQYRTREDTGAAPLPPASVAALWRPWRRVRLV